MPEEEAVLLQCPAQPGCGGPQLTLAAGAVQQGRDCQWHHSGMRGTAFFCVPCHQSDGTAERPALSPAQPTSSCLPWQKEGREKKLMNFNSDNCSDLSLQSLPINNQFLSGKSI